LGAVDLVTEDPAAATEALTGVAIAGPSLHAEASSVWKNPLEKLAAKDRLAGKMTL
jgi:hypothetical protein